MKATIHHPIASLSVLEMHTEDGAHEIVGIVSSEHEALELSEHDFARRRAESDICPHHYKVQTRGASAFVLAATINLMGPEPEPDYHAFMEEGEGLIELEDGSMIYRYDDGIAFRYGVPVVDPEPGAKLPRQTDDGDVKNCARAARAKSVIIHYENLNGETLLSETVKDLITDLGHFLDRYPSIGRLRPLFESAGETYLTEAEGGAQFATP
jgi:hypothetical protein